jgi:anthranilate/para-aminobenzoate synthase component I
LAVNNRLTLWVGAGIVVESDPEAELAETLDKARAFTRLSAP